MDKLFIASNNAHKINEIKQILIDNGLIIDVFCPKDFDCKDEPIEDGLSFEENAYIKAKYYFDLYKMPTLADDSGITIEYFNDLPGIHSSRFLHCDDYVEKNEKILDLMKNVKNRNAKFIDVICFIDENQNVSYSRGENAGLIAFEQKGDKGFGYDPIFIIPEFNKTEAELGEEYKNKYSHRAKALQKWVNYVK